MKKFISYAWLVLLNLGFLVIIVGVLNSTNDKHEVTIYSLIILACLLIRSSKVEFNETIIELSTGLREHFSFLGKIIKHKEIDSDDEDIDIGKDKITEIDVRLYIQKIFLLIGYIIVIISLMRGA